MKISYYPDTDSMYIDFSLEKSVESDEVAPGIVLDYDFNGNLTGIDIDNASRKLNLEELILNRIPMNKQTITVFWKSVPPPSMSQYTDKIRLLIA